MKTNWPIKKLGEVCEDVFKKHPSEIFEGSFSYIDISSVDPKQKKIISPKILNVQDAPGRARKIVKSGDIIFATTRPYLENIAMVSNDIENPICSTGFCVISPKREMLDSKFAFLVITSSQFIEKVVSKQKGASYPAVSDSVIYDLEILLPPLKEQKRIVKVLEEKLGKVKETIRLRQDAIADTEKILSAKLGEIFNEGKEKGWEEKTMDELCEVARGGSPRPIKDYLTEDKDGINWVKIGDASASDRYIYKTRQKIKQEGVKKTRLVHSGDLLLTNSMSFGRPYIMKTEGAIHDGWLLLSPREKVVPEYLYYFLSSPDLYRQFKNLAGGAVVQNLNSQLVRGVKVSLPDFATQEKIVEELDELSSQVSELRTLQEEQLADLKSLERAYLHEAFNGELV